MYIIIIRCRTRIAIILYWTSDFHELFWPSENDKLPGIDYDDRL